MTVLEEAQVASDAAPEIQTPERCVVFMARRESLRLTWVPRHPQINSTSGIRTGMSRGKSLGFRDGVLRIPLDREDGMVRGSDTLDAGDWESPVDEVLTWLRKHRLFGNLEEGFWEVPEEAPPVSDDELSLLQDAALGLDLDALRAFIEKEESGWNRDQLLDQARRTLGKVEELHEQARIQAEAAAADAASAAKVAADEEAVKVAETAAATPPGVGEPQE